jgi:hypothetical protein
VSDLFLVFLNKEKIGAATAEQPVATIYLLTFPPRPKGLRVNAKGC